MGELRKDYILDRWVIIASERSKRPKQFSKIEGSNASVDYFAPGNESMTPAEIGRLEKDGKWQIRWFENKFPALEQKGQHEIKTDNIFFTFSSSYGAHEVIVETPDSRQLYDLDEDEIKDVFGVYTNVIEDLEKKPEIKYVMVFKNHGQKGGTSIIHSHSQVMALNHVPKDVKDKVEASKNFSSCPYCDIIKTEMSGIRRCFENDEFAAFCPYASRFNYEIWVFPKEHIKSLSELKSKENLAGIMKIILSKIKELGADYNYFMHYAPKGEDLHFHIEISPRIATWAGFEIGSGEVINSVSPEDAAAFYRGEE